MNAIILDYEHACNDLVIAFYKKQGIEFDGWVADEIGGIAGFSSQYFFHISDIVYDLKTKQPKGLILEWQNNETHYGFSENKVSINYYSYCKGLRHDQITTP